MDFSSGSPPREMAGSYFAERELLRAALSVNAELEVDFWCDLSGLGLTPWGSRGEAAKTFVGEYAERIYIRSLAELREGIPDDYLFVCGLPGLASLNHLRERLGRPFAICGITHSLLTDQVPEAYRGLRDNLRSCDRLVATSTAAQEALKMLLGETTRTELIPLGVNVPELENLPDRHAAREVLELPQHHFVLLYVGRISAEYKADLDGLVLVLWTLRRKREQYRLILAGFSSDPVYSLHLDRLIADLDLSDAVIRIDNFPESARNLLLRACDVFISPADSIQETFGLSLLEAMAMERPVITSSWSGYRDLVVHGETGWLLKSCIFEDDMTNLIDAESLLPAHAFAASCASRTVIDCQELLTVIERLFVEPAEAVRLGVNGRCRAQAFFRWESVASRYLDLWHSQVATLAAPDAGQQRRPWFAHYADVTRKLSGILKSTALLDGLPRPVEELWPSLEPQLLQEVRQLAIISCNSPLSTDKLHLQGYSSRAIVWLLKKGLCRLERREHG